MASSSLLTTVPADFLSVIYLLNYVFKNATNHTPNVSNNKNSYD